ncbi:carbohydrate sulfotransferase 14-like [Tigriopus californicus]|uniref:carbohydrate sulfotransferase 14-like n=1 Tax=Tigriopus californicus TaxID=6832 RepID=UPI0027D9E5A7|nr:carbohydrate sulfotransferase 14-like [Tigriopus californicus]
MRFSLTISSWQNLIVIFVFLLGVALLYSTNYLFCSDRVQNTHIKPNSAVVQLQRIKHLNQECLQYKDEIQAHDMRPKYHLFLMEPQTGLTYCHVPKVASSFWYSIFSKMFHGVPKKLDLTNLHSTMLDLSKGVEELPESAFKMIFVRHPIKRLVSAYVEKFVDVPDKHFVASVQKFMQKQKAAGTTNSGRPNKEITFPIFVKFVIHETRENVISSGTQHWTPYTNLCQICRSRLDFVGHLETLNDDAELLIELFPALKDFVPTKTNRVKDKTEHNASLRDDKDRTRNYLAQLDPDTRKELLQIFSVDCRLFGYDCYEFGS